MDNTTVIAVVAAVSAVLGGLITGILAPYVQHRLELSPHQINDAQTVVQAHLKEIENAWNHHFGG